MYFNICAPCQVLIAEACSAVSGLIIGDHRSRSGWLAFGGTTMAPALG
jgi:hypothetical protein